MGHELHVQLFTVLCLFGWGYALFRGDWPERLGALLLIAASVLSVLVVTPGNGKFTHVEWRVASIDGLLFAAFAALAILSRRSWLIWMASFQLLILISHFPILVRHVIAPESYTIVVGLWPWIMMPILIGATQLASRRRRANTNSTS
jgi:hypothetical protein